MDFFDDDLDDFDEMEDLDDFDDLDDYEQEGFLEDDLTFTPETTFEFSEMIDDEGNKYPAVVMSAIDSDGNAIEILYDYQTLKELLVSVREAEEVLLEIISGKS